MYFFWGLLIYNPTIAKNPPLCISIVYIVLAIYNPRLQKSSKKSDLWPRTDQIKPEFYISTPFHSPGGMRTHRMPVYRIYFTYHTAYINTLGRRCYKILTKLKFHLYPLVNQPWMLILLATVKKAVVWWGGVEVGGKDTRTTPYPMFFTYSGSYPQYSIV